MNYKYLFLVLNKETKQLSQAVIEADHLEKAEALIYSLYCTELYLFFIEVYYDVIVPLDMAAACYDQETGFCEIVSRERRKDND